MNRHFYLFLPKQSSESNDFTSTALIWVTEDASGELKLAQGLLADAASAVLHHRITIVLPGEDVLFLRAEVPGKNLQRIQQAVPYVLEDSVIDDVDELHFSISKAEFSASEVNNTSKNDTDNYYDVSVINKYYLESVINQLKSANINADVMIADYMLLTGNNILFFDGLRVVFNGQHLKFSSSIATIEEMVNLDNNLIENNEIKLIRCEKEENRNSNLDKLKNMTDVNEEYCDIHPSLCLIKNISGEKGVNLLQGVYKKKKNWSKTGKTWIPIAALFLVWVCIQGALFITDYISLNKQNEALNTEITKIYIKTFPKARKTNDAKASMKSKLISLRKRKGQSGRRFTEMLSGSAFVFSKAKGLKIKSLRYYDGRINLELQIANLQALDELKNKLNKEKGYEVEIQNASSGEGKVTARIQITGVEL